MVHFLILQRIFPKKKNKKKTKNIILQHKNMKQLKRKKNILLYINITSLHAYIIIVNFKLNYQLCRFLKEGIFFNGH